MKENNVILRVDNISKQYRLGLLGTGSITHDLNRFWCKIRGLEDPYLKIGEINDRSIKGDSEYVWALKDVSFDVKKGEVLGIIGKNGAGKSTLLKILSKVTAPTTGSIKSKGRIASLLEVGTGFHPEMTGRENIYLNGAILGMTKKEITSKIDEIIEFSGCDRYIDTPTKRYSSGMTVRLAFAVAAFLEPDILIVDEVLAVGDVDFQKKAIGKMQDISSSGGRTVLFVSHDMTAIRNLCTKVIMLKNAKIFKIGKTDNVISEYLKDSEESSGQAVLDSTFVSSIRVLDKNKKQLDNNIVNIGDHINIEISLKEFKNTKLDYCFLGVENEDQKRVFSVSSNLDNTFVKNIKSNDVLYCGIDYLNITSGRYKVFVALGTNMPKKNLEIIRDALFFEVFNNNFYSNGENLTKAQGDIVFKSKWEVL